MDGEAALATAVDRYGHHPRPAHRVQAERPPTHTNHRALLMRLITPKRLKENEDAMWQLADDILDTFLAPGEGEFIKGFAGPFTLRVIADLLGVPEEDRDELIERLARGTHGGGLGNADKTLTKTPLEYLYEVFATYVEDRRREPRDDVLTGLATATFPDGSMPEVGDVVRVATNVFSAGQETTVRLLGTALEGDRGPPRHPAADYARTAACSRTSSRSACASRAPSRATSGCRGCRRPSATKPSAPAAR